MIVIQDLENKNCRILAIFGPAGKGPLRSLDTKGQSDGKENVLMQ